MAIDLLPELFYEERSEKIISHKEAKPTFRIARFLKPIAQNTTDAVPIPKTPLLSDIFSHNLQQWPSKVVFRGWKLPQRKWKQWVEHLAGNYCTVWERAGICDAIVSSVFEIRPNPDLVMGLSEFWCPDTNTFVFPWGEATITLEDMQVLGRFPVTGDPVTSPLPQELLKLEEEMLKRRREMGKGKARKASHDAWLRHFTETLGGEFEHIAFLALWLSRYVFPSHSSKAVIGKHVFPIAAHLSRGRKLALAPAVLSSLYRDLSQVREKGVNGFFPIAVSGPFQLLQLWAFERFPLLGPMPPNALEPGQPRAARWHKLSSKTNLPLVRSALVLADNFVWRPYAANLENWRHFSYYKETEQFVTYCSGFDGDDGDDDGLKSYVRAMQPLELVGVDCREKYLPHRVARQFGMDQDLPGDWSGSMKTGLRNNFSLFVPLREFEPGVSVRYLKWWEDFMLARKGTIKVGLERKGNANKGGASDKQKVDKTNCNGLVPEFSSRGVANKATGMLKKSPFTESKNSKGYCRASVGSRTLNSPEKISQVSSGGVASKASGISEKLPFTEAKNSKGDCLASAASRTMNSPEKISQVSLRGIANKARGISEKSPFTEAKTSKGESRASVVSRTLNGPRKISEVSSRGVANKETGISEKLPSTEAKKGKGNCRASVGSRIFNSAKKVSQVSSRGVANKATGISPKSPFMEGKKSKGNDHVSVASRVSKSPTKTSQVSLSVVASKATGISEKSPLTNGKGDFHASVGPRTQKSPTKVSQHLKKCINGERQEFVPPRSKINLQKRYEDLRHDGDLFVARSFKSHSGVRVGNTSLQKAYTSNLLGKDVSSTLRIITNERCRRQDFHTKTEGKFLHKVSTTKASSYGNAKNGDARDVKRKVGASSFDSDPLDFMLSERIKRSKTRESTKEVTGERKIRKAGKSSNNPISIDGHTGTSVSKTWAFEQNLELEGRVRRLEKLLGVGPRSKG